MTDETSKRQFLFLGDYIYDLKRENLKGHDGQYVQLRPQSAEILKLLAQNAGDIVLKEELIETVWQGVSVTDDSIVQCVSDIRRALKDTERGILKTVPKKGYRLIAGTPQEQALRSHVAEMVPDETPQTRITPRLNAEDILPTVAVIPFQHRATQKDIGIISEVLADDITSVLSRSFEISVISRLSTIQLRPGHASLSEIGAALRADFVLSGRCSERSNAMLIEVELAEVNSGRVLWSDQMQFQIEATLDTTEVVDWVIRNARREIFRQEVLRSRSQPLPSLKGYTLLLSAVSLMHRLLPADFELAKTLLDDLIERVPNHPVPLAWMAKWHVLRVLQGWSPAPSDDAEKALNCTKRALDLDPENVLALISEGFVLTSLLRRIDEAEQRYDAALDLSPNDAMGRLLRGTLFAFRGQGDKAMRDTERSLHLTPLDPIRYFFLSLSASACIAAEDYERALILCDTSLKTNDTHTSTLRVKTVAQMRLGQTEAGRKTAQKLLRLQPNLSVQDWLKNSPSADFPVGAAFAATLREAGIPN